MFHREAQHCNLLHMSSSCSGVFSISKWACNFIWAYKPVDVNRRDASVKRFPLTRIKAWFIFTYENKNIGIVELHCKITLIVFFYKYLI